MAQSSLRPEGGAVGSNSDLSGRSPAFRSGGTKTDSTPLFQHPTLCIEVVEAVRSPAFRRNVLSSCVARAKDRTRRLKAELHTAFGSNHYGLATRRRWARRQVNFPDPEIFLPLVMDWGACDPYISPFGAGALADGHLIEMIGSSFRVPVNLWVLSLILWVDDALKAG